MNRQSIRRFLIGSPARIVAKPFYAAATAAVCLGARSVDRWVVEATRAQSVKRVTAIVKTFERPVTLSRLLESVRRLFPELRIIVADDSRRPRMIPGIEVVSLPFDSGVSAGRHEALSRVKTEFTWLLDDDFILHWETRLDIALEALDQHAEIDLVGGTVIDLPFWMKHRTDPNGIFPTRRRPLIPPGTCIGELVVCNKVPNFFVARTERLRLVDWTPELKRLDHADFFTRACGILVSAQLDRFRCLHAQTPFDSEYQRFRLDFATDREILSRRHRAF